MFQLRTRHLWPSWQNNRIRPRNRPLHGSDLPGPRGRIENIEGVEGKGRVQSQLCSEGVSESCMVASFFFKFRCVNTCQLLQKRASFLTSIHLFIYPLSPSTVLYDNIYYYNMIILYISSYNHYQYHLLLRSVFLFPLLFLT